MTQRTGITPARAGKTRYQRLQFAFLQDHPRACGENKGGENLNAGVAGSPPRVRGKH